MPGLPAHHRRRRGRRQARVLAAATVAAVLGAVVAAQPVPDQSPQTTPPTPASQHTRPAVDWNSLTAHIGLTTTVVPAATNAHISVDRALAIAATLGLDDLAPGQPTTDLCHATSTHPEPGDAHVDRLVWMLAYPNSPPILTEPPGISDQQRHQLHDAQCAFVIVIDATTGQVAATAQHCQPP